MLITLRGLWVDKIYTGMRQGRKREVFLFMWWKEGWTILSLNLSLVFLNLGNSYEPLSSEYCGWDTPNEARKTCEKGTWPLTYNIDIYNIDSGRLWWPALNETLNMTSMTYDLLGYLFGDLCVVICKWCLFNYHLIQFSSLKNILYFYYKLRDCFCP